MGMATPAFLLGQIHFKTRLPNQSRTLDFRKVPFLERGDPIPKSGRIAIQFVACHPLKGQTPPFDGTFQQFQPNFWFRFGCQIGGDTAGFPLMLVSIIQPAFRQKQLPFNQAVSFPTGVP
jgi:hypothetical protein